MQMEAGGGSRTPDTMVRSHVLFPLSYTRKLFVQHMGNVGYLEAGDEARTRDLDVGNVALFRLSYARLEV